MMEKEEENQILRQESSPKMVTSIIFQLSSYVHQESSTYKSVIKKQKNAGFIPNCFFFFLFTRVPTIYILWNKILESYFDGKLMEFFFPNHISYWRLGVTHKGTLDLLKII